MPLKSLYDIGDAPRFSATFEVDGVATNPTATLFKFKTPAGTETTYTHGVDVELVRDSTGQFHVDFALDTAGVWHVRWVGTGSAAGAEEYSVKVGRSAFDSPLL